MNERKPCHVGSDKVLLFDDHHVEEKSGFSLALGQMVRDSEPVLVADRPWEAGGIIGDSGCTVIEEGGEIRLWYMLRHKTGRDTQHADITSEELAQLDEKTRNDLLNTAEYAMAYAVSRDGSCFEKPSHGLIDVAGSRANNLQLVGRMGGTVFVDPVAPPQQRYKCIHGFGPRLPQVVAWSDQPTRHIFHSIYGSHSPDGIHWTTSPEPIMSWYTDTTNVAYYDQRIKRYVAFCRWNENLGFSDNATRPMVRGSEHYRAIGRSESEDFFRFPRPTKIAEPSPLQRRPRATGMDYYNTAATKVPGSPDAYMMFSSNFYHEQDGLQVHLATSRDGIHYDRWEQPILSPGLEGRFDSRSIYMASGIVQRGGEMWMYYHGRDVPHGSNDVKTGGGIGRVRLRLDGFVSQQASHAGGTLLTAPLHFTGNQLLLNMDAGAGGRLKVELCDLNGSPIAGHTADDADWLFYNDVARAATWRGSRALPATGRAPVRLRFIGSDVRLYSFQFVDAAD